MKGMATMNERVDKHDREIAAIRKLIHTGMKMMVQIEKIQRELAASQRETDKLVQETSKQLQAFIRSLRGGGGNGQVKHRVH
jgi:hypothetical protein